MLAEDEEVEGVPADERWAGVLEAEDRGIEPGCEVREGVVEDVHLRGCGGGGGGDLEEAPLLEEGCAGERVALEFDPGARRAIELDEDVRGAGEVAPAGDERVAAESEGRAEAFEQEVAVESRGVEGRVEDGEGARDLAEVQEGGEGVREQVEEAGGGDADLGGRVEVLEEESGAEELALEQVRDREECSGEARPSNDSSLQLEPVDSQEGVGLDRFEGEEVLDLGLVGEEADLCLGEAEKFDDVLGPEELGELAVLDQDFGTRERVGAEQLDDLGEDKIFYGC